MAPIDRRKQVIQAAAQSFALFGYKATTMDQVAKIANVGKGTIYTFFTNKEELFDEILHEVILEMKHIAERELDHEQTFASNLFRILDSLLEFREQHELLIKLSQEVREFGTVQAKLGNAKVEGVITGYLEKELRLAQEKGEIKPCDPKVAAYIMLKLYIALTSDWSQGNEPLGKEQIKQYIDLFLVHGLTTDIPV
ncbi:TetR/AcrR family transcriptional regulator [Paenibacillus sp. Marseille-Q4541]|uniref:TetR/AcrR family transcriptional regulator n=1 Tax=Paenibacillus sp. Marseille-Q4541 TaxID=2831522 RepID=UPI001BA6B5C4|nr:TetR/AcrR family transcriptional regulator [Paenibacillus sp. Marseille-Q4541]